MAAFAAVALALIAVVYLWHTRAGGFVLQPSPDQNVLLVTIDTLRADALSSYGGPARRADVVVARALDWIGKQPAQFFAWVHVFDPHSPYKPPDDLAAQYGAQPYYGEIAFVDRALGPLFDELATLPRPTLVIVTADHGESLGEPGEMTHGMF